MTADAAASTSPGVALLADALWLAAEDEDADARAERTAGWHWV